MEQSNSEPLIADARAGKDLDTLRRQGRWSNDEVVVVVAAVAAAVDQSHAQGVIHRDLKPENILLDSNGRVQLTNFGPSSQDDVDAPDMSAADQIIGTLQYMAPEQADRSRGPIDARTDVYGLGGLLFALLTDDPPVVGANKMQVFAKLLSPEPNRSPREIDPDIPASLELICTKALAKDPAERYQSAREFEEAILHSHPGHHPSKLVELAIRSEMLYKRPFWVIPSVIVTMCLPLLIVIMMSRPKGEAEEQSGTYATASVLAGEMTWQLSLFKEGEAHRQVNLINAPLVVQTGDSLQFHLKFEEAVFPYVFWIDSEQGINVLHAPRREDDAEENLVLPGTGEQAYPVTGGTGTEMLLVILREEPVADPILLTSQLTNLPSLEPLEVGPLVIDGTPFPFNPPLPAAEEELLAENLSDNARPLGNPTDLKSSAAVEEAHMWIRSLPLELGEVHFLLLNVQSNGN